MSDQFNEVQDDEAGIFLTPGQDLDNEDFGGFDIADQLQQASAEDEGAVVVINGVNGKPGRIKLPNGEIVPVTITVTGVNSRRYKAEQEAIRRRQLKKKDITSAKFHEDSIELAAACTVEWTGILNKGQPVRCDRVNAAQIYKLFPHILEQVQDAMNEHALFTKGSSPKQ